MNELLFASWTLKMLSIIVILALCIFLGFLKFIEVLNRNACPLGGGCSLVQGKGKILAPLFHLAP